MMRPNTTYRMHMNGTINTATPEMRLSPPNRIKPTRTASTSEVITVTHEYVFPNRFTVHEESASKKEVTAFEMLFTCENVPIPKRPTMEPKIANRTASHFQFFPIPFSIV